LPVHGFGVKLCGFKVEHSVCLSVRDIVSEDGRRPVAVRPVELLVPVPAMAGAEKVVQEGIS
jgi:hypothetical protein